jgi:cytochrome P450
MRHPTYTIVVSESDAPTLIARLNRPRNPESETTDAGLGPRTTPSDPTELTGLVSDATLDTPTHRWLTLPIPPRDVDRLESIVDAVASAQAATWHPDAAVDAVYESARELPESEGLEVTDTEETTDGTL